MIPVSCCITTYCLKSGRKTDLRHFRNKNAVRSVAAMQTNKIASELAAGQLAGCNKRLKASELAGMVNRHD